ncbi:MAG: lipopolysaccharide assembly protein LapA domain-containing protein [Actinobacteria bacterium]|nr:lipopolysaccharide assembly protein LapA domain-containing protein [Actinomycetota bacterium]
MSDSTPKKSDRKPYILLIVFAIVLVYLLAFSLLNTAQVSVSFVVFSTTTALIWVMIAAAGLGLVLGIVGTSMLRHRHRRHHQG